MRAEKWLVIFFVLFYLFCFCFRGAITLDPDFGWHIRAGEYILAHGIPYKDPFSYSMPSYLFVDHEWLSNITWAVTMRNIGYWPLVVLYALFGLCSVLFLIQLTEKKWLLLPVFLSLDTLMDSVGVRTQVIDWFLLSSLLVILWKKKLWEKWRFFLPLLFLFWSNVHGGFGIGLGILAVILIIKSIEDKKGWGQNVILLIVCILITLVNPFGIRLWGEFFSQLTDTQLRNSIAEWYPAVYFSNLAFWLYLVISGFLIFRYYRRYTLSELTVYVLLLAAGLSSMRNIPLWMLASFPLTAQGFSFLAKEAAKHEDGLERFTICYYGFFIIACIMVFSQLGIYFYSAYITKGTPAYYPVTAVKYLDRHLPQGQIFSEYGWGGYLLWKLPEKKDFIDGRMPSWRWHLNSPTESNYAFDDYKKLLNNEIPFSSFAAKYHITTLLIPVSELDKPQTKVFGIPVQNSSWFVKLLFSGAPNYSFYYVVHEAKQMGWKEIYRDGTSVIIEKQGVDKAVAFI